MRILVTGASGMIGSLLVDRLLDEGHSVIGVDCSDAGIARKNYRHVIADIAREGSIDGILQQETDKGAGIDRTIHLAALAHVRDRRKPTWEEYIRSNVDASVQVFQSSLRRGIPVLYISTVDVYGRIDNVIDDNTVPSPVSMYGKSKHLAEIKLVELARMFDTNFTVFRLSPVYADNKRRDIQKRYYLKYPHIAYRIGKGSEYEILSAERAIDFMTRWCDESPTDDVRVLKDNVRMWTPDYIREERSAGRANVVLVVPRWVVKLGYRAASMVFRECESTYLLFKAAYPYRSSVVTRGRI